MGSQLPEKKAQEPYVLTEEKQDDTGVQRTQMPENLCHVVGYSKWHVKILSLQDNKTYKTMPI